MTHPPVADRSEIELAFQLAGWLPFDPGMATRLRDFHLAKTQAAYMAGGVAGLLRECRAQAWRQLCATTPQARTAKPKTSRLAFAVMTHLVVAHRVRFEMWAITGRLSPVAFWLARQGKAGRWLASLLTRHYAPFKVAQVHWKIFKQIRQGK